MQDDGVVLEQAANEKDAAMMRHLRNPDTRRHHTLIGACPNSGGAWIRSGGGLFSVCW